MRRMQTHLKLILVVSVGLAFVSGCGKSAPRMNGQKWAHTLSDPDVKKRKRAAVTLGNIGPPAPGVGPALIGALKDADGGVRFEAIVSLLKLGRPGREAIPALTEIAQIDEDESVRMCAAKALRKMEGGS